VIRARRRIVAAFAAARIVWPAAAGAEPPPPPAAPVPSVEAAPPQPLFDLGWDSGKPLSIRSDELEYVQGAGTRRLMFQNHVSVEQDGMTITSTRLEAFYPPTEPAGPTGGRGRRAPRGRRGRAARAVYERAEVLTCEGGAELQQGQSRLSGDVIEIDLGADRVRVRGGAAVMLEAGLADESARTLP
jgi:lipopolysaccharide export system protein LptA